MSDLNVVLVHTLIRHYEGRIKMLEDQNKLLAERNNAIRLTRSWLAALKKRHTDDLRIFDHNTFNQIQGLIEG